MTSFLLLRLLALYLGGAPLYAQTVGANSSQLLSSGPGAESSAMAGTSVSTIHDPTSLYWNPAGLTQSGGTVTGEHLFLYGGARYDFVGLTVPSQVGTFGLGALQLNRGNVVARTSIDDPGTQVSNTQSVYMLGYGRELGEHWSAGVVADVLDFNVGGYSGKGFGLDAGTQGRYGQEQFLGLNRVVWSVGAMVKNLVEPTLTLNQDSESYPREYRAGAAMSFETASRPQASGIIEHDRATVQLSVKDVTGAPGLNPAIGLAYDYLGVLVFRLGYDGNVSGGMGFHLKDEFFLDYSMENEPFALDYRFTLSYRFGAPIARPEEKFREVIDEEYDRAKAQAESLAQENFAAGQAFFRDQEYGQAEEPFRLAALLVPENRQMADAYRRAQEAFRVKEIHLLSTDATMNPAPGQEATAYRQIAELLSLGAENKDELIHVLRNIAPRIPANDFALYSQQVVEKSTEAAGKFIAAGEYTEARQILDVLEVVASTQSATLTVALDQEISSRTAATRAEFSRLSAAEEGHADAQLARAALGVLRAFPNDAESAKTARAALERYRAGYPLSIKERFYLKKLYYLAAACYARRTADSLKEAARYVSEILSRDPSDEAADALGSALTSDGLARQ